MWSTGRDEKSERNRNAIVIKEIRRERKMDMIGEEQRRTLTHPYIGFYFWSCRTINSPGQTPHLSTQQEHVFHSVKTKIKAEKEMKLPVWVNATFGVNIYISAEYSLQRVTKASTIHPYTYNYARAMCPITFGFLKSPGLHLKTSKNS